MPSRSHGNLGDGIVRHLLKAGHEVSLTYIYNVYIYYITYIKITNPSVFFLVMLEKKYFFHSID